MASLGGDDHIAALAALVMAAPSGRETIEFFISDTDNAEVRVRDGRVESFRRSGERGVGVRLVDAGRVGYAWTTSLSVGAVDEALRLARRNAQLGARVGAGSVPSGSGIIDHESLFDERFRSVSDDDRVAMALEQERAVRSLRNVVGLDYCSYQDSISRTTVVNSLGLTSSATRSQCSLDVLVIGDVESTSNQTGHGYMKARSAQDLRPDAVARMAGQELDFFDAPAGQVPSGPTVAVFSPRIVSVILGHIGRALAADTTGRASFLSCAEGEVPVPSSLLLVEDRTNPEAAGALPFDAEGVRTAPLRLYGSGAVTRKLVAGTAVRNSYKSPPTPGTRALWLQSDPAPAEDFWSGISDGVMVMSAPDPFSGFNLTTGAFSFGFSGRRIMNGRLGSVVRNIGISGTLQGLLASCRTANDRVWPLKGHAGCTMLIPGLVVSSASDIA